MLTTASAGAVVPKASPSVLQQLRRDLVEVAGGLCEWPGCSQVGEQMAHLQHRGMGGSVSVNRLTNVALLCVLHHDMFDGRRPLDRFELRSLFAAYLKGERSAFDLEEHA